MFIRFIGLVILFTSIATLSHATEFDRFYLGLGASFTEIEYNGSDLVNDKTDNTALGVVFGYQPSRNIAFEIRDLLTVSERVDIYDGQGSLLIRGIIPIHPYFNVYGIGGMSLVFADGFDDKDTDLTYGIGMRFRNSTPLVLDVEYQHLYEGNFRGLTLDMSSVNLNILYGF